MVKQFCACFTLLILSGFGTVTSAQPTPVETLKSQARDLLPMVESRLATRFLKAAEHLPGLEEPRPVYYNRSTRDALTEEEAEQMSDADLEGYQRVELGEQFYYNTMYGTPLAAVRALDLAASAELPDIKAPKVLDFGFGSIGQLRLLAMNGCRVTGIEIAPLLKVFYREEDTGDIPNVHSGESSGNIQLLYGFFPAEQELVEKVGRGYDLVISKNTLKKGYVNPDEEIDPRRGVDLKVSDEKFLEEVHRVLKPGGLFMIYNLSPAQAEGEAYNPQADGRSPFPAELYKEKGFEIVEFNRNDTEFAHAMAGVFGWDQQMNLETDLRGMFTLLRKR